MYKLRDKSQVIQNEITLKDGSSVLIRQINLGDVELFRDFINRLAPESLYSRYLSFKQEFSTAEEIHFCSTEAGERMALVAEKEENGKNIIVGLAEYETVNPGMAEVGIVVEDRFQGLGMATKMLKELVDIAIIDGIEIFSASVHPNNTRILKFIRKSKLSVNRRLTYGAWEIQVELVGNQ